jgi:tetratricopeptide (TPR) repeat protein
MDIGQKIKTLLQEADLYRKQGLLKESIEKYTAAAGLIKKIDKIKNRSSLLEGISKKVKQVKQELETFENAPITPEMESRIQDLIKDKFSFAKEGEAGILEGAIALAKFGQSARALDEFRTLVESPTVGVAAAKNIIRCHVALESYDDAVLEYRNWLGLDGFSRDQLENLRVFFQSILDKKGIDITLEQPADSGIDLEPQAAAPEKEGVQPDELLDISSIGILMEKGPQKGQLVEFDVSFQSGNEISLLIPSKEHEVIEHLSTGTKLADIEFYSPFAMFKGAGMIISNTKIATGPKRGDFSLDIRVTSV